jgi:hypothetical protein
MEMKGWHETAVALFRGKDSGAQTGGCAKELWKLWKTEKIYFAGNRTPILQSRNL